MSKQIIKYTTNGSFSDILTKATSMLTDALNSSDVEKSKITVDKENGIIRLDYATRFHKVHRFLWIANDPYLTGEINTIEERERVVKCLYRKGLTQIEIGDFLSISQSLVSKDLRKRR